MLVLFWVTTYYQKHQDKNNLSDFLSVSRMLVNPGIPKSKTLRNIYAKGVTFCLIEQDLSKHFIVFNNLRTFFAHKFPN